MSNGKGSQQRGSSRAERQRYEAGWERVFGAGRMWESPIDQYRAKRKKMTRKRG